MEAVPQQHPFVLLVRRFQDVVVVLHGHYLFDPDLTFRIELVIQRLDEDEQVVYARHFLWDV